MDIANKITTAFSISLTCLLLGIVAWRCWAFLENRRKNDNGSQSAILPFYFLIIGMLAAGVAMFYPAYFYNYFGAEGGFVTVLKSLGLSLHNTMRTFIMDGEFDAIRDIIEYTVPGADGEPIYVISEANRQAMSVYGILIFVLAPIITFGTVLTFFKNLIAKFVYFISFFRDVYVLSELNERSLALAENIFSESKGKRRPLVVFADVFEKNMEDCGELVVRAHRLGAICFSSGVDEIGLKPYLPSFLSIKRKVFFISMDEDSNLEKALEYIPRIRANKKLNNKNTAVYVFVKNAESEPLLDSVDHGNIRVRRVDENRNFAIDIMRKYPIFDNAYEQDGERIINVAVIGLGAIGTELMKTIIWSGQMLGYELNLHVFHSGDDAREAIRASAPDVIAYNDRYIKNGRTPGEPFFRIHFHNNTDVKKAAFLDELAKAGRITTAYVTLGDDELNIETAMKLRMHFIRSGFAGDNPPKILSVVFSDIKANAISSGNGLMTADANCKNDIKRVSYDIEIVGSLSSMNSLDMVEQLDLEARALECHLSYDMARYRILLKDRDALLEKIAGTINPEEKKKLEDKLDSLNRDITQREMDVDLSERRFSSFGHFRRSSVASALHIALKESRGLVADRETDPELFDRLEGLEHERWTAYMITEGYVYGDTKDFVAKTNPYLVRTEQLDEDILHIDGAVISNKEETV